MAVRGVYTQEEKKLIEQWKTDREPARWLADKPTRYKEHHSVNYRTVTKDLILNMANAIPDKNPLWRDESYASNTRWGSIIAPPYFEQCITHYSTWEPIKKVPSGLHVQYKLSSRWDFYKPIRIGDSFRVWLDISELEDITREDGNGPRTFRITRSFRHINQKNELVCLKTAVYTAIVDPNISDGRAPCLTFELEKYKYTQKELDFIERIRNEEVIRGAEIRWWEDVQIGDELQPVVYGPSTVWDAMMEIQGMGCLDHDTYSLSPDRLAYDPETGVGNYGMLGHVLDGVGNLMGGMYGAYLLIQTVDHTKSRIVTNWMGDDGFIKVIFNDSLAYVRMGDTVIARGKVIKKYILSDGEHVVDLVVWLEGIRGYVHEVSKVTVGLLSKESYKNDILRY